MLVNASRVRNVLAARAMSDAAWLVDLDAHGLVTASLVPPPPIRALRDLTRTHITRERSREVMWLEALLVLIAGHNDPAAIADLAKRTLRRNLTQALVGRTH